MRLSKIIDNERSSMLEVIRAVCGEHDQVSIATGYWDLGAIAILRDNLESLSSIRLLIGREPLIPRHQLDVPEEDFPEDDFSFDLSNVDPSSELRQSANDVSRWIAEGKLHVRVYTGDFLHAKAFVFGGFESDNAVGIIGSSNFTRNGLTQNTELNALESDHRVVTFQPKSESQETGHLSWFEGMWNDEKSVEWTEKFGQIVDSSPVGNRFFSPFEMYLKTLHVLYKQELDDDDLTESFRAGGRSLFEFQQKNAQALQRRLNKYKVAMLSDSVGLGKTITAINVIRNYADDPSGRRRVEVICPKSLVQQWEKELTSEGLYGQSPITLQNSKEIDQKRELDKIAAVSLFVIDESHNLRQTTGIRYLQLLNWIRNNPKAHVLLLTATPINNNLSDLSNQILLGTGGDAEVMKITATDHKRETTQVTFHQAVENLKKKINQDLRRDGQIDFEAIRQVMTPIIRTFVVRRTRHGIEKEYGSLVIDGQERSFPKVNPGLIEYHFSSSNIEAIRSVKSEKIDLERVFQIRPSELMNKCKHLSHPYTQSFSLELGDEQGELASNSPMFYIFQMIMLLGFVPYRWMMYQTKFYGKSREQIHELKLSSNDSKRLLLQLGIFGILRTVFLKRMESSVSALRSSLEAYKQKLTAFEQGVQAGRIVSVSDMAALEASFGDEDLEVDDEALIETTLDSADPKKYDLESLISDITLEKEILSVLDRQLEIISQDDAKIKEFARELDRLKKEDPDRKVLVFSYFSDTVEFLKQNLFKHSSTAAEEKTGFLTSKNRKDAENLASRFSPRSKLYELSNGETELNLLISTDVLSEGQNLQDAGVLINFDLHWNPVRMIQRNGRVNRLGSLFEEVEIFNTRPESELDGYLRLIQRLQGKIDIIRNTIGTDTPVLEEAENPIEYSDSLSDIYSQDLQKRMKALDQAEKASDYLLSEDEFVMDLKKFRVDPDFSDSYKKEVLSIPRGKWGVLPDNDLPKPPVMGLAEILDENGDLIDHQFVEVDAGIKSVKAISGLQALSLLRASSADNQRVLDKSHLDRVAAKGLIERGSKSYSAEEETGGLIGQEMEVLRILFKLSYSEEEIDLVRDGFKTRDVFFKRQIGQIKRQIMLKHKQGNNFQPETLSLIAKAREIANVTRPKESKAVVSSQMVLGYMDRKFNA